jgi:hypothetical protein
VNISNSGKVHIHPFLPQYSAYVNGNFAFLQLLSKYKVTEAGACGMFEKY